ncbi:hypothetical protein CHUAL_001234 [Chamberlinius hualienensis]
MNFIGSFFHRFNCGRFNGYCRVMLICLCLFLLATLYVANRSGFPVFLRDNNMARSKTFRVSGTSHFPNYTNYIVDTTTCRIPNFDPRDPEVKDIVKDGMEMFNCGDPPLTSVVNRVLIINSNNMKYYGAKKIENIKCCYKVVSRKGEGTTDNEFRLSNVCENITNGTVIEDEFIRLKCSIARVNKTIVQFHFTIPLPDNTTQNSNGSDIFSVMAIGFDSLSRLNFQRHMPKTRNYLLSKMKSVEMFGYTKSGDNTIPNLVAVLGGYKWEELKNGCFKEKKNYDKCNWIWKKFKCNDHVTLYGEDTVAMATFNYLASGFFNQPTDFYLRPFLKAAGKETASKKHWNTKLCLGPIPMHEVTLNWGKEFMMTMKNDPYFGFLWTNSLTHDELNYPQWADNFTFDMLDELYSSGSLDKVILILMGDHGMRWGKIRGTTIGRYENRLPAMYIYVPQLFRQKYPQAYQNLLINSRRLTTPFDLHYTFKHILKLQSNSCNDFSDFDVGMSLFTEIPEDRTCDDAGIDPEFCACDEDVAVGVDDEIVLSLSKYLVQIINILTDKVRDKCEELVLRNIISARKLVDVESRDKASDKTYYRIVIDVEPSEAMFESTAVFQTASEEISIDEKDIIRMNLYGNQSSCVDEREFKDFCYCIN